MCRGEQLLMWDAWIALGGVGFLVILVFLFARGAVRDTIE